MIEDYADRHHAFEGCFNFRDVGGYATRDGYRVKWGKYFRAGRQDRMTELDLDKVRGMDIGTDKVLGEDRQRVPHHGLDLVRPDERYSAGQFARDVRVWVGEISGRGRIPVIVGGTGFFLKAVMEPVFVEPTMDAARVEGVADPVSTQVYAQNVRPFGHHAGTVHYIEELVLTGTAAWPPQRTLLTTGTLEALMDSSYEGNVRLETPHLKVAYDPPPGSRFQGEPPPLEDEIPL